VSVDLGVLASDATEIDSFSAMASKLGLTGFAIVGLPNEPFKTLAEGMMVYSRVILHGKSINSVRKQIDQIRRKSMIVSVPLKSIEVTNWAAEDKASISNTSLEIQIAPLLKLSGLNRSKILKLYRESVTTAMDAGMDVVLTSGAIHPMGLRSSVAMAHIGILLGMDRSYADRAASDFTKSIIERNMKKLQPGFVNSGVEIIHKGEEQ